MKKCEYCAKEITYFEQYCSDDCHIKANKYYEKSERFAGVLYVVSMICLIGIPVGLFLFSFIRLAGALIASISAGILGLILLVFPAPTEGMIKKYKIKSAVKRTRIFGIFVIILGILILGLPVIFGQ